MPELSRLTLPIKNTSTGTTANKTFDIVPKRPLQRKVLLFGDSYMLGIGGNVNNDVELVIETLRGWDVQTFAEGGLGYIRANTSNHKCIDMINNAVSSITDKNVITDCVLACSVYNELGMIGTSSFNESSFLSAITDCVTTLKTNFPYAKITLIPALWCNTPYNNDFAKVFKWEINAAIKLGLNYVDNSINWLIPYISGVTSTDDVHPTHAGYEIIAAHIASVLEGCRPGIYSSFDIETTSTNDTIRVCACTNEILIGGTITKESGQSFSKLCDLPSYCRSLYNIPIRFKRYDTQDPQYDISALLFGGSSPYIYLASDRLVEEKSYIVNERVPYFPLCM